MRLFWAYFTLIRIPNCLVAMAAVAVGQYLTPEADKLALNSYAMAAAFFVCGFGNIINDIRDIESDRINHPQRALPSGTISRVGAGTLAFLFLIVSLLLLIKLNGIGRIIVVTAVLLVVWYNIRLKHTAYLGNLAVSLLGALTFLLGGATYGFNAVWSLPGAIVPAVFAFLMHFGREIIKDIEDSAGDALAGSVTAPLRSGVTAPLILVGIVFAILVGVSLAVYWQGWFSQVYLYIILIFIHLPLTGLYVWLIVRPERERCRVVSAGLKIQMIIGLVALLGGRIY